MRTRLGQRLPLRFDLIGQTSILADDAGEMLASATFGSTLESRDVRLRVAGKHEDLAQVDLLLREVVALWTCGPAGGGGARTSKRQRLSNQAFFVPRELVPARFDFLSNLQGDAS